MRTLNPFVFIVQMLQLFPDLLFSVSGGNAILTTDTWTAQAFNAPTLHAPDILLFVAVESVLRHYKATSAIDLQAAPPRITTTTKAPAPNNAGCGHSGTQAMRTLNPFVFIVQRHIQDMAHHTLPWSLPAIDRAWRRSWTALPGGCGGFPVHTLCHH
uniref:Putative secreted protein n=1 Tax=Rhipicephalus microplus TaxID=6941 RepID=A0A6M2D9J4_RHIMP